MPHQCTNCGRLFADGSKEMLSGCPNCGGNKFQFSPSKKKAERDTAAETADRGSSSDAASSTDSTASDDSTPPSTDSTASADDSAASADSTTSPDRTRETDDEEAGSTTWRRAANRAVDHSRPDDSTGRADSAGTNRADGDDVDTARRRGQTLRDWANSRGFASEVEDENDETTLRENRRRTGDAQRRPPERRSSTEGADSPDSSGTAGRPSAGETQPSSERSNTSASSASGSSESPSSGPPESTRTPDGTAETPTQNRPAETPDRPAETPDPTTGRPASDDDVEDDAQASARSDVVSPDEIRAASEEQRPTDANGRVIEPQSDDRPNLDELREELNDQFESIKIVAPGEYELNLMELYDRPEYIISLREDGRYVIEVPDTWGPNDDR